MLLLLAFMRLRQEDCHKFQGSLVYNARSCLKTITEKAERSWVGHLESACSLSETLYTTGLLVSTLERTWTCQRLNLCLWVGRKVPCQAQHIVSFQTELPWKYPPPARFLSTVGLSDMSCYCYDKLPQAEAQKELSLSTPVLEARECDPDKSCTPSTDFTGGLFPLPPATVALVLMVRQCQSCFCLPAHKATHLPHLYKRCLWYWRSSQRIQDNIRVLSSWASSQL